MIGCTMLYFTKNPLVKATTQQAPLEKLLSRWRARGIEKIVSQKKVLDFGCGTNGWISQFMIDKGANFVHGCDSSLSKITYLSGESALYPSIQLLPRNDYEVITAFAVFEHLYPLELIDNLRIIHKISSPCSRIIGTVPTIASRPVLEFLSFKLKLIDSSQIYDHKVYYDDLWLSYIVNQAGWILSQYSLFQLGMNSRFELKKQCST